MIRLRLPGPVNPKTDAKKCDRLTIRAILWPDDDEDRVAFTLCSDGIVHKRLCQVVMRPITPAALASLGAVPGKLKPGSCSASGWCEPAVSILPSYRAPMFHFLNTATAARLEIGGRNEGIDQT
jgi:hypothetical protein